MAKSESVKHKPSVLLIEDDIFLAGIYQTKFELEGFRIAIARDGEEGLRFAAKDPPDVILLDILLPKLDGFEVLSKLKEQEKTKHIPVVMLTNLGQKEDVERAMRGGAIDYLIKAHFVPSETVAKVKKILTRKK
jgi:DNA-binding response OmpR family regulator